MVGTTARVVGELLRPGRDALPLRLAVVVGADAAGRRPGGVFLHDVDAHQGAGKPGPRVARGAILSRLHPLRRRDCSGTGGATARTGSGASTVRHT